MSIPAIKPSWAKEDEEWFFEHYVEIAKAYPDKWVAVYGKKVVAYYSSEDRQWIMVDPGCTANPEKECFSFFVNGGVRVY